MPHFAESYADLVNELLHRAGGARFFKQEIVEVPESVTGLLVTYDGVNDDSREIRNGLTVDQFLDRMALIKPDWKRVDPNNLAGLTAGPGQDDYGVGRPDNLLLEGGGADRSNGAVKPPSKM